MILDHEHGVGNNRCKHPECVRAVARYRKQWALDHSRGLTRTTDVEKVRLHIFTLIGRDWSLRAIAGAAGCDTTTISKVSRGAQPRIRHDRAQKILNVRPDQVPSKPARTSGEPFVSRVGAVRRIQAMLWMGHTHEVQYAHSGIRTAMILAQQGRWVTRSTHDKIAEAYRRLSLIEGPSNRTRGRARKLGYVGPAAWENIDLDEAPEIDDTKDSALADAEEVDEAAVLRRMNGDKSVRLSKVDAAEVVRRCLALRWSKKEIERLTGLNPDRYEEEAA